MASVQISADDKLFATARDKVVIITGGANGIGEATVRLLHSLGAKVSFLDINEAQGKKLEQDLGRNVEFFKGSVTVWEDQLNLFEQTIRKHGRIDIVLANAGIDEVAEDVFEDKFDETQRLQAPTLIVLDVTLRGVLYTTKLALSFFRRFEIHGALVITGSASSYLDTPGVPIYATAKHGVLGLARSLRDSLSKEGLIRVNIVAPAFTDTAFTKHLLGVWQVEHLPINTPNHIARALVFLGLNSEYHGKSIYVAAGTYTELEDPIQASRNIWLGKQNTNWVDQRKSKSIKLGKQDGKP